MKGSYSNEYKAKKVEEFCSIEGYNSPMEALEEIMRDNPGTPNAICMRADCDFTEVMEDDQDEGWCSSCADLKDGSECNTVVSIPILMGII